MLFFLTEHHAMKA